MVKQHLTKLAAPNTWLIPRRRIAFTTRPKPGAHAQNMGLPLVLVMKNLLKIASTLKEVKYILNNKQVLVDGKQVKDVKRQIGLMDVVSIPETKKSYRLLINKQNKLFMKEIDDKESKFKLCKVVGKSPIKAGKMQLNLHDAKNIISKEKVAVGDTVVVEFGKGIAGKIEFKEGNMIFLTSGKHVGKTGSLAKVIETKRRRDEVIIKSGKEEIRTSKRYAFVVGDSKSKINLE